MIGSQHLARGRVGPRARAGTARPGSSALVDQVVRDQRGEEQALGPDEGPDRQLPAVEPGGRSRGVCVARAVRDSRDKSASRARQPRRPELRIALLEQPVVDPEEQQRRSPTMMPHGPHLGDIMIADEHRGHADRGDQRPVRRVAACGSLRRSPAAAPAACRPARRFELPQRVAPVHHRHLVEVPLRRRRRDRPLQRGAVPRIGRRVPRAARGLEDVEQEDQERRARG